jgi:hypothetical protein
MGFDNRTDDSLTPSSRSRRLRARVPFLSIRFTRYGSAIRLASHGRKSHLHSFGYAVMVVTA